MSIQSKVSFLESLRSMNIQIARVMEGAAPLAACYTDRGFDGNHSGSDPIIDTDVAFSGITSNEIYANVQMLNALDAFFTSNNDGYRSIVNIMRNDK